MKSGRSVTSTDAYTPRLSKLRSSGDSGGNRTIPSHEWRNKTTRQHLQSAISNQRLASCPAARFFPFCAAATAHELFARADS